MYYIAVVEVDPKWEKNNDKQVDFKNALDEKIKLGGSAFGGKSANPCWQKMSLV